MSIGVCSSGGSEREREARASAADFLSAAQSSQVEMMSFKDGFFPEQGTAIKSWFEDLKGRADPDLILTHRRDDAHQDHRQVSGLTWNTFRDHCILEYEIPKWDGDMGQPNLYVPISASALKRKIDLLISHFGPSAPSSGSMPKHFSDWLGSEAWNVVRRSAMPKHFSGASLSWPDCRLPKERRM